MALNIIYHYSLIFPKQAPIYVFFRPLQIMTSKPIFGFINKPQLVKNQQFDPYIWNYFNPSNELQLISSRMNSLESLHQELTEKYSYRRQVPIFEKTGYFVYEGILKELNVPVTIKLLALPPQELGRYIKKLKDSKVENTIKIYEIFQTPGGMYVSTEQVTFSNLKFAMAKCQKLDDSDAVFMSRVLLSAHVDLLRAGLTWFGTEEDIQFTEGGLRLSWNNSIPFQTQNPFPLILSKIAGKMDVPEQKILPFPKSRILEDLIKVSSLNASEISLSTNMKRKEKVLKRKGRNWLGLRQSKNDFEYYEQTVLLAVHKQFGFIKIKIFEAGRLDQQILFLNKSKNTFTKLIDNYEEGGKAYLVSEYSNDGTLYNYVNKLKANAVALKEEQIQFFFFSLFEPLKLIQDSSIKSLCMLHIRNIYIENGIPKIGEPVPFNAELVQQLKEKADVPDFYHSQFKKNPNAKTNTYDTYSLGVLLYKLMYTEYPIFPEGKVHIPTSPNYNKRLKTTLQIFLNEGGLLKDIEKKIEVSAEVAKQVRLNKNKLLQQKKGQKQIIDLVEDPDELIEKEKKEQDKTEVILEENYEQEENDECCKLCCAQLEDPTKHKSVMLDSLEESPYASYRIFTKTVLVLCLYIFLLYFSFMQYSFTILGNYSQLQRMNVTISTVNYEITVTSPDAFYKSFNVTDRSLGSLVSMGCFINNYQGSADYTAVAQASSFQIYVIFGLISMVTLLVFKALQLIKFDLIRTLYNMSNLHSNFNMSNYIINHLFVASLVNDHYIFFNQIFNTELSTCLGVNYNYGYGSTDTYFTSPSKFMTVFGTTFILHFFIVLLHLIMILRTDSIRYTRIFNPILLLLPFLIGYSVVVRLGMLRSYFYPSLLARTSIYGSFFTNSDYVNLLGILPEILFLFQLILEWIVDWLYWFSLDKKRRMIIQDASSSIIL